MTPETFITKYSLSPDALDGPALMADFISEMERGLSGPGSSLAMMPTYIAAGQNIPQNEPVLVIDAGGTNFRVASIRFDETGIPSITQFSTHPMPGTAEKITAEDFFREIASHLQPILNTADRIGFCFSYPTEITPDHDGRLVRWTKEIKAPGVVGAAIGRGLLSALGNAGTGKHITLLNDATAALLAGKTTGGEASRIGFILGTGTNIAYLEKNEAILKARNLAPTGIQAINVESGGFDKILQGPVDLFMDQTTETPGHQPLEKMIAGRYLSKLGFAALTLGTEEGLFSAAGTAWILSLEKFKHGELNNLLSGNMPDGLTGKDREAVHCLLSAIIRRAAKLSALVIAATARKAAGIPCLSPLHITIDGSTYYKAVGLRAAVEDYLADLLGEMRIQYTLGHVENAPLIGAAIAGLIS